MVSPSCCPLIKTCSVGPWQLLNLWSQPVDPSWLILLMSLALLRSRSISMKASRTTKRSVLSTQALVVFKILRGMPQLALTRRTLQTFHRYRVLLLFLSALRPIPAARSFSPTTKILARQLHQRLTLSLPQIPIIASMEVFQTRFKLTARLFLEALWCSRWPIQLRTISPSRWPTTIRVLATMLQPFRIPRAMMFSLLRKLRLPITRLVAVRLPPSPALKPQPMVVSLFITARS